MKKLHVLGKEHPISTVCSLAHWESVHFAKEDSITEEEWIKGDKIEKQNKTHAPSSETIVLIFVLYVITLYAGLLKQ